LKILWYPVHQSGLRVEFSSSKAQFLRSLEPQFKHQQVPPR